MYLAFSHIDTFNWYQSLVRVRWTPTFKLLKKRVWRISSDFWSTLWGITKENDFGEGDTRPKDGFYGESSDLTSRGKDDQHKYEGGTFKAKSKKPKLSSLSQGKWGFAHKCLWIPQSSSYD